MSRGLGMWQRWLIATIKRHGKPITFEEIGRAALDQAGAPPGVWLRQSPARSMRRALHGLVKDGFIVALGKGGRAEPHRYFPSPIFIGMSGGSADEYEAVIASLNERDLSTMSEAMRRLMRP